MSSVFDYGFWSYDKNENAWISCVECVTTAKNTIYYCINAGEDFVEYIFKTPLSKPFLAPRIFYIDALIADENIRRVKSVLGTEVYKLWHIVCHPFTFRSIYTTFPLTFRFKRRKSKTNLLSNLKPNRSTTF